MVPSSTPAGFVRFVRGLTFDAASTPFAPMITISRSLGILAVAIACLLSPAHGADAPTQFKVSNLAFQRPPAWEWVATQSQMRKAQLKVPNPAGAAGEIVFFHFGPNNGGGTQANVDRWFRQFQGTKEQIKARTEEGKAGTAKVTYVFAEGTYLSGMPGEAPTPKPDSALVGAIVEDPEGSVFVKYTGPKALVTATTADFKKLVEGAKH